MFDQVWFLICNFTPVVLKRERSNTYVADQGGPEGRDISFVEEKFKFQKKKEKETQSYSEFYECIFAKNAGGSCFAIGEYNFYCYFKYIYIVIFVPALISIRIQ